MKKRYKLAAIALSASLAICGCAAETQPTEDVSSSTDNETVEVDGHQIQLSMLNPAAYGNIEGLSVEPGTYISIVGKSADQPYWKAVEEGAKQAVADLNAHLGYEGSDKIKFVYSGPSESYDVDEQVNILDEELARYPHALGIALVDAQSCGVQFDLAAQNGISVVTFDTTSDYQGVMARIETDNKAAATEAAKGLAEAMGEMGEVVIFMDESKSENAKIREAAFIEEITANHPGVSIGNIYYEDDLEELKATIISEISTGTYEPVDLEMPEEESDPVITLASISKEEVYNYIFLRNENMAGIYATSSFLTEKAVECCEKYGRTDVEIVGFDSSEKIEEALEEGIVDGIVLQNPYGMGYATVVACARSIMNEGNEALVNSGYTWVDTKSIKEEAVQSILY